MQVFKDTEETTVDYMKFLDTLRPLRFDYGGDSLFERTWKAQEEERQRAAVKARLNRDDHRDHIEPESDAQIEDDDDRGRYKLRPGQWHQARRLGPQRLDGILREVVFTKTTAKFERIVRQVDDDNDGYLTYAQFKIMLQEIQLQLHIADAKWVFDRFSEVVPVAPHRRQQLRQRNRRWVSERQRLSLPVQPN